MVNVESMSENMAIGMLAPANDENPINHTIRGNAGVKVSIQPAIVSQAMKLIYEHSLDQ